MDELSAAVDVVVEAERGVAAAYATRAAAVENARLLGEADAVACRAEASAAGRGPRSESGWTPEVIAWRELVAEIACALRLPERSAEALIAGSRALVNDLPATHAALSAGEISYRHAEKLIDHATSLPVAAQAGFEDAALPFARELTVAKFDKKARVIRERIHPESIAVRTRVARELRNVFVDPARDGMAYLTAYLPAPVAVAGYNRIDDIASTLRALDGETRTLGQLRTDVFADLVTDGITEPTTARTSRRSYKYTELPTMAQIHQSRLDQHRADQHRADQHSVDQDVVDQDGVDQHSVDQDRVDFCFDELIADMRADAELHMAETERVRASLNGIGHGVTARTTVTVPALTLLDRSEEPATVEGYGPIDADTARELAAGAPSWNRILTHPETGAVLSIGRDSYTVPADMRRYLEHRDQTCRHPGCNRRARKCDLDHSLDWYYDGQTGTGNLAHLCAMHHHLKHHTRWRYQHTDDQGTLKFTSPTGRTYVTRPDNIIGPNPPPPRSAPPATSPTPPATPPTPPTPPATSPTPPATPPPAPPRDMRPGTVHFE